MKKSILIVAAAAVTLVGCVTDQTAEIQRLEAEIAQLRAQTAPIPASLDNLFPPKSEVPVWQIQMHNMATPLTTMVGGVLSGDFDRATKYFGEFKKAYVATSKMVPEWESKFDMTPLALVDEALASGDPEAVMGAVMAVGGVCHNCHYQNMARVQQLYHWPRFSEVSVTDPNGGELSFTEVMRAVEGPLVGIGVSLQEGSPERAAEQLQGFKKSLSLLEETCEECHETERTYFVDESIHKMVDRLEQTLSDPSASPEAAGSILQGIGQESCHKCHLVHIPAAFTQKTSGALAQDAVGAH